jgi:crotonobetainyl-CoA:carnitine CoA-transferase CaiB-like acyl-CoA transferase
MAAFTAASIPAMPVRDIADIRRDPHLDAVRFFSRREHPTEGSYYEMKNPVRFSGWNPQPPSHPQNIGEDTELVRSFASAKPPA